MRPVDVCTTLLVTTGNRALRDPTRVRWADVEEFMSIGLRPESRVSSRVTMLDEQGGQQSFQEWLEAGASPQARLWFAPGPWETDTGGASGEMPAHIREAFAGGGGLGLLLFTDGRRSERFMPREVRPRLYKITGSQLYAFYRSRERAEAWDAALEREFGPELEGGSVRAFLESRGLDDMQEIVPRFMSLIIDVEPVGNGHEMNTDAMVEWNTFVVGAPGSNRLSFEYLPIGSGDAAAAEQGVSAGRSSLASALEAVREFAERQDLKDWSRHFRRCLLRLSLEPQPLDDLIDLLLINGLSVPAVQLVNAAMAADVFGGMGSWNDLGFDGPDAEQYAELSNQLLQAMRAAFRSGINSSAT